MKKKKGNKKLNMKSDMSDIKPKQEFSGSSAKGKSLPARPTQKTEFGGGKY